MHDLIQGAIDGIADTIAQLQVNLTPTAWTALEWVAIILGGALVIRICMAGVKTVFKVLLTVGVIVGLGVYFGYIRI